MGLSRVSESAKKPSALRNEESLFQIRKIHSLKGKSGNQELFFGNLTETGNNTLCLPIMEGKSVQITPNKATVDAIAYISLDEQY